MTKNIKKVYICGGGKDETVIDKIAIMFDDDTTEYIDNDFSKSTNEQVKEYMQKQYRAIATAAYITKKS